MFGGNMFGGTQAVVSLVYSTVGCARASLCRIAVAIFFMIELFIFRCIVVVVLFLGV